MIRSTRTSGRVGRSLIGGVALATVIGLSAATAGAASRAPAQPDPAERFPVPTWLGEAQSLGNGAIQPFVEIRGGTPQVLGVTFSAAALTGLPVHPPTDGEHCFDVNGDGVIDPALAPDGECVGGYELRLPLASGSVIEPYQYVMVNWNPEGHTEHIYGKPHFDFHFYLTSQAETDAIRMGPCGELIDCEDQQLAIKPLPAQYLPAGYIDPPNSEEGQMGDHIIDPGDPAADAFERVMIFGKFNAQLTFIEPMITKAFIESVAADRPTASCQPIKQPQSWQRAGWYPQQHCVRWTPAKGGQYAVTLEDFYRG